MDLKVEGGILGMAGFVVLIIGGLMVLGTVNTSRWVTDSVLLFGLVLLVAGCALFGKGWTTKMPGESLSDSAKWSLIATFVFTVVIAVIALWADARGNVIWTAVSVGAFGGLVHEIAQSKGTAFLPGTSQPDNQGENYLGGLIGMILGGAAGLLILSTSTGPVSTQFVATAFAAGVALKGISDSASSPPKSS